MQKVLLGIAGSAIAVLMIGAGFAAGRLSEPASAPALASASGGMERGQVEAIVRDYLIRNPEVMIEVQTALTAKQEEAQKAQQLAVLDGERDAIFNAAEDGIIGNPQGKTTVVEFFDYNCGYCKHALSDMQAMVQANPDLRFVMKELPILGPDSQKAHVVSAALKRIAPEKYAEFHIRLLGSSGRAGEAAAMRLALDMGVDEPALRRAMQDPAIDAEFARTYDLASKLSITGTPSYVIGDEVVFGAVGAAGLTDKLATMRATN
jgi:protein-disulfide isomerase